MEDNEMIDHNYSLCKIISTLHYIHYDRINN